MQTMDVAGENPGIGSRLLLNGEWEFAEGEDGTEAPTTGWGRVRVPHRSREFEPDPPASGWYRTTFRVPSAWDPGECRILLDLGRVRHYGRAYLDGLVLGEHYALRAPWRLTLTDVVEPGGEYALVVYTHNCSGRYAHPRSEQLSEGAEGALDTTFWYTSAATIGMEENVWLILEPLLRIDDVYVVTSVREKTIAVEVTVRNETETKVAGLLRLQVTRGGQVELDLPDQEMTVAAGGEQVVRLEANWESPVLWGRPPFGEPVLYFLEAALSFPETALRAGGGTPAVRQAHRMVTRFGFREVWADGDRLLLNGQQLMPWGDHSIPYVHERQWLTRKLVDLADGNISIVEHHRYDAPPVLYDVADELGVFVVSSNICVGSGQVPRGVEDEEELALIAQNHLEVVDHWIRRDRNHPSILFWDVTDAREPEFCIPLLRKVKELDRTRIVEVTYDHEIATPELAELIDTYRLFSSLERIEAAIAAIRGNPDLPVKPIRVGEAGIFASGVGVAADEVSALTEGWWEFLVAMPERNIHGLQTFFLTDMDYRDFLLSVPGNLAAEVHPRISWPSQSGLDARIDPFGEGTRAAWGKAALYLNWCDPGEPISRPTATRQWSRELFRRLAGRDVGPLATNRLPEVIVRVERGGQPVPRAHVFAAPLEGQGMAPFGIQADAAGTSWFTLPEPGLYSFTCEGGEIQVAARCEAIDAPPGYGHIQEVLIALR
jgi:hypothetical protein